MSRSTTFRLVCVSLILALSCILILLIGCSDDDKGTGGDGNNGPRHVSIPLEGAISDQVVTANVPGHFEVTLQLPPDYWPIAEATIDVAGTLPHVSLSQMPTIRGLVDLAGRLSTNQPMATLTARVGDNPLTVCDEGVVYGTYIASTGFWTNPDPATIPLGASTIQIMNTGSIHLCLEYTSSMDGVFSIDEVEADIEPGDCASPADFSGTWEGTYSCGNSCGSSFGGDITITITQNGNSATYTDDGGATYHGKVCGNVFRFERVQDDEIERGTLILDDLNHATKNSTWRMRTSPFCSGNCTDILTRVVDR